MYCGVFRMGGESMGEILNSIMFSNVFTQVSFPGKCSIFTFLFVLVRFHFFNNSAFKICTGIFSWPKNITIKYNSVRKFLEQVC